jgi:hypothetical protein
MGLMFQNGPAEAPKPQQPSAQAAPRPQVSAQQAPAQQAPASAPKQGEALLSIPAGIKELWVSGIIQGGVFLHATLRSDRPLPKSFRLTSDITLTHVGLFGKELTLLRANDARAFHIVTSVDGKCTPQVKKLDDGTYESEYSFEYTNRDMQHPGKRGTHRLSVTVSGGALAEPFSWQDEFKV